MRIKHGNFMAAYRVVRVVNNKAYATVRGKQAAEMILSMYEAQFSKCGEFAIEKVVPNKKAKNSNSSNINNRGDVTQKK